MVSQQAEAKSPKFTERVAEQVDTIVTQLAKQEEFIQMLSKAIQANQLEEVMTLLASNREFVTSDFIASRTGHMLANYLLESATDLLLEKYPFLHLSSREYRGRRVFYIGNWYKADTRHIMYLSVNLNNNMYYSLDLQLDEEVTSEWRSMEEVKVAVNKHLTESETAYAKAQKEFDHLYSETLVNHKQALEDATEQYELLNTKMLKKQSEIDALENKIAKEKQIIERIQKEPELYFSDAERKVAELQDKVQNWRKRVDKLALIEALVKREQNEISEYMTGYEAFIQEIEELAAIFGGMDLEQEA